MHRMWQSVIGGLIAAANNKLFIKKFVSESDKKMLCYKKHMQQFVQSISILFHVHRCSVQYCLGWEGTGSIEFALAVA